MAEMLRRATFGLADDRPSLSACRIITYPQALSLSVVIAGIAGACFAVPHKAAVAVVAIVSFAFLVSLGWRTALAILCRPRTDFAAHVPDDELPVYSILVPVYREAGMIVHMKRALMALDYPAGKLDILLVVEEDDSETRAAVQAEGLHFVVVPPGLPRTKPKACNYALAFARGEFLVVYDAEDRPDPDQLRKAVGVFRAAPQISCLQARLSIDAAPVWISRMFAIDYALWFRTLLPGLARLRVPLPLGGTSNHFRIGALRAAGAWDPFNVTEDADLGVRLARLGYHVTTLDSATEEEAPARYSTWLRQRTRWMKGYMQTVLVHTRNPKSLLREIGPLGAVSFLTLIGGAVWSALINPLLWIVCIIGFFQADGGGNLTFAARFSGMALLAANGLLAAQAVLKGGVRGSLGQTAVVFTYPLYWLLLSVATYRALWQLLRDPFYWEKTPHGSARR